MKVVYTHTLGQVYARVKSSRIIWPMKDNSILLAPFQIQRYEGGFWAINNNSMLLAPFQTQRYE